MSLILSPAQCAKAAAAYRALLRAQRLTFKGDELALKAAHQQTRVLFNRFIPSASASRSPFSSSERLHDSPLPPPPTLAPEGELTTEKVDEHIAGAFEIAEFLKKNVVQGIRTDEGNYSLRIHEETERGDNDSIKKKAEIPPEIKNVNLRRRRRRKGDAAAAAEAEAPVGCCGGGAGGASASA
ncbi:hypothetical protein JCM10908_004403 [Rhodotorula pacifica]|uniref:Mzm1p n=1 Tax=Rhodotorula pacifica TaxID=1495444 RepID=UPI00316FEECD